MREDYFNSLNNLLDFTKRRRKQFIFLKSFLGLIGCIGLTFLILNLPAFFIRANYTLKNTLVKSKPGFSFKTVYFYPGTTTDSFSKINDLPANPGPDRLEIQKIGVAAPVTWGATAENVRASLQKGVAHITGTAKPDQAGNILITGHSSDFWWQPGNFKNVFVLLDKLVEGDQIRVVYNGRTFDFKVSGRQVIRPEEIGQAFANQPPRTLILMTCTPIGTAWKRLLIFAKPV